MSKMGEDMPKKKKTKKLSLLVEPTNKLPSMDTSRLEEKSSNVLPPRMLNNSDASRLHLPMECKKKSCHCKKPSVLDYN